MTTIRLGLALLVCSLACAALAADRTTADAMLAGVPPLAAAGDYKAIEELCKLSLRSDDTCPLAHFYVGLCLEKTGKAHDAFKEYQNAVAQATKEKDNALATKAGLAAKRIGAGLVEIDALDSKLADKLQKIGAEALESGRIETAKQSFAALIVLQPDNAKAKEGLEKATKYLKEHVSPLRAKIAAAMLAETWYKIGCGQKAEAAELAKSIAQKYAESDFSKEATAAVECDLSTLKKDDIFALAKLITEQNAKTAAKNVIDIDAIEKAAAAETAKLTKEALVPSFSEAHKGGKAAFEKASPGADATQENLTKALEHFIHAQRIYARIESENIRDDDITENSKEAATLQFVCMKMIHFAH